MNDIEKIGNAIIMAAKQECNIENLIGVAEDTVGALEGNPFAIFRLLNKPIEIGGSIKNLIFYSTLKEFLEGISSIPLEYRVNFLDKYVNGKEEKFSYRLVQEIDRINHNKKIDFLVLAFKKAVYEEIDLNDFFRMSNIINTVLYDDLIFLKNNINRGKLHPSVEVMSLASVGLMYIGMINSEEENQYCFTEFAFKLAKTISEQDIAVPNLTPQITAVPSNVNLATEDDINSLFNK